MGTELQNRVDELKGVIEKKRARAEELIQSRGVEVKGENVSIDPALLKEVKGLFGETQDIEVLIDATKMGKTETEFKSMMSQGGFSAAMQAAAGLSFGENPGLAAKDLGTAFTESEEFKHLVKSGRYTMDTPYTLDVKDLTSYGTYDKKDIYTGLLSGAVNPRGFGRVQFDPAVPRPQRTTRVRDLFPVATTSANLIDYFRVLGFAENNGEGNAAPVPDRMAVDGGPATGAVSDTFGVKPQSTLRFQSAQASVRTIAHWEAAHRNVLQDEPQLQATINNELLYGLALEEDYQILLGTGENEDLLGLLRQPYTQRYSQAVYPAGDPNVGKPSEPKSDALRRAATMAIIANYAPTGYAMHPYDWEEVELQKDGEGRYMLVTNISVGAESRVWRQPVVETPAMPQGTFVTGAWGIGAQLYDRQLANVRIAEQHANFFVMNAIAILVEERLAFAVKRPESFVIGRFWQPTS